MLKLNLTKLISLLFISSLFTPPAFADLLNGTHWVIKSGDSLYKIARNIFPEDTKKRAQLRKELVNDNPQVFKKGNGNISVGDKLKLPAFAAKQKTPAPVVAVKKPEPIVKEKPVVAQVATPDPEDIVGKVLINVGSLSAQNRGATRDLSRRSVIYRGDTISTGSRSLTQIRLKDGALLSLRPHTNVKIAEFHYNGAEDGTEQSVLELLKGGFRTITGAIGHKNKQNYKIRTSVATIGIRGTHYSLVLCQNSSCSNNGNGKVEDGLYGGVADGSIVIENETGIHKFNNDQFFKLTSASSVPIEFLLPPAILKNGPSKLASNNKKTQHKTTQNITKEIKSAPRRLAVIFEPNQPSVRQDPKHPRSITPTITPIVTDVSKAPNGSAALISFNHIDNTGAVVGAAAPVITAFSTNNTVFLGPNRTPIAIKEFSENQQGVLEEHEVFFVTPDGALATLVPSSVGGDAVLGVNWGRWNGDYIVKENGVALNTSQDFHYIYSEKLTPMSTDHLAYLGGLKGSSVFYTSVGGTLPTDHLGNVGAAPSISMGVDFINQEITDYSISARVGVDNYGASLPFGTTIPFQNLTGSFNIENTSSGCPSFTGCTGEASVVFIGNEAQGAISSYHIDDNLGDASITGTALLTEGAPQ